MTIQIDTREKPQAIKHILDYFDKHKIEHISSKLFVGDYTDYFNPRVVIDRKKNLLELATNVAQDHKRFTAELARAKELGVKLIILCEHGGEIEKLSDVANWNNPRLERFPLAISGERLHKILLALSIKYEVDFVFCNKKQTGPRILSLLENGGRGII